MFERPHHQRIAQVLRALNAPLLRENQCLFGGGTAIALRYGEYRESVDIDFLVSGVAGALHAGPGHGGTQSRGVAAASGAAQKLNSLHQIGLKSP